MGSYKIRRLKLSQNIIDMLEKQNLNSCKDILSLTKLELQTMLGLSRNNVEKLLHEICKKCVSKPQTAHDMYVSQESTLTNGFLPSSLHSLDLLLQGGLNLGSITEIAGPPGVGKTQFCFMLSILAALPVPFGCLDGQVIYIDTESAFYAERLRTIAKERFPRFCKQEAEVMQILERIFVHKVNSVNALKEIISQLEKEIIRKQVKLIIVDSIASLLRKELGTENRESLLERNKILLELASSLKDFAQTYKLVVFLSNQIASHYVELDPVLSDDTSGNNEENIQQNNATACLPPPAPMQRVPKVPGMVDSDHIIPALGNTWFHCVNTRLVAQFLDSSVRKLTIVKSPVAPNASVRYILDKSGIVLTDDDIEFVNMANGSHKSILTKNNFLTSTETGTGFVFSTATGTNT